MRNFKDDNRHFRCNEEEIEPILKLTTSLSSMNYGENIYYFGKIYNHNVVIAYSKIGKVFHL